MSPKSAPAHRMRTLSTAALLVAIAALLGGCGGGSTEAAAAPPSGNPPPSGSPPAPTPVTGVAMPSSVAVVTATNAQ